MESSHRWTFVRYFGTQQVPIGMPGPTDGRTSQILYLRYVKTYGRWACLNIWEKLRQFSYGETLFP